MAVELWSYPDPRAWTKPQMQPLPELVQYVRQWKRPTKNHSRGASLQIPMQFTYRYLHDGYPCTLNKTFFLIDQPTAITLHPRLSIADLYSPHEFLKPLDLLQSFFALAVAVFESNHQPTRLFPCFVQHNHNCYYSLGLYPGHTTRHSFGNYS